MSNGQVEIHDPFSQGNGTQGDKYANGVQSPADADGMEDTVEFRLLMAYATRRRREEDKRTTPESLPDSKHIERDTKEETKDSKKTKRKKKKGIKRFFSCIKPITLDEGRDEDNASCQGSDFRSLGPVPAKVEEKDEFDETATRLTEIADEIPFTPPDVEVDCQDAEVERLIGLLLREAGDNLNERELQNLSLIKGLPWNYGLFNKLMTEFLTRLGLRPGDPDSPGPKASPKTQIAVACEATSRLCALDTLPMNRVLGFGARFLSENFSTWVGQQGGYDATFQSDEEDEVH